MSRDHEVGQVLALLRLAPSDELFLHRDVIQIATSTSVLDKQVGRLLRPAARRVMGSLASLKSANTLVPADYGWLRERLAIRLYGLRRRAALPQPGADAKPWFVQGSWINHRLFQIHSRRWQAMREGALASSHGLDVLASAISADPRGLIHQYQDQLGERCNHMLVQIALHFNRDRRSARNVVIETFAPTLSQKVNDKEEPGYRRAVRGPGGS
jgi:hypothetical protein